MGGVGCVSIQTNAQLLNVNAANLHRFPEVPREGCEPQVYVPSCPARPALSPWVRPEEDTGNGWVRAWPLPGTCFSAELLANGTTLGWFARCDSSVHCRPLAARGVLLFCLILQFLSLSICLFFVLTYLLKRIKYKLIDK